MSSTSETLIQGTPPAELIRAMGTVNFGWAQLDAYISAALFSLLQFDPVEFGILIGRMESITKLGKMLQLLKHRKDATKEAKIRDLKQTLERMRSMRNTITHGFYLGRSEKNEFFFNLTADFMLSDEYESANELVVFELNDLTKHISELALAIEFIITNFDNQKMRKILNLAGRTRLSNPVESVR